MQHPARRRQKRKPLRLKVKRAMATERDYKEEYKYHKTADQKARRAGRNKARRAALASGKATKGDKKDVHHKDGNPTNNKSSNVSVVSRKKNRGTYRFA